MVRASHPTSDVKPASRAKPKPSPEVNDSVFWSLSIVVGKLVSSPIIRETTAGVVGEIDVETLAMPSPLRSPLPKVSVSVVGPADLFQDLTAGDVVVVVGTTRRRFFRSGGATVSRTEVEAHRICRRTNKRAANQVLAEVRAHLDFVITTPAGPSIPRRNG